MLSQDHLRELRVAARRGAIAAIKSRARHLARRPATLDLLHPGLGCAAPPRLIAIGAVLIEREMSRANRLVGFGGEVGLVNARAVLLLGRTLRRFGATFPREQL